jgi:predicted acylesterase/phospholipase RssA
MSLTESADAEPYRILCLDGGGAKGFYSLGVLREIEGMLGCSLHERFDLIYGTSTGSIIAALLALGTSVTAIHDLYRSHVPRVMKNNKPAGKSKALGELADDVFGDKRFDAMRTGIGIVTTNWLLEKPMIFKNLASHAHGSVGTFVAGFGCTISDAVQASCSAYPLFERKIVQTSMGDKVELVDGGYCANNPTLYAIADAVNAVKKPHSAIQVVSVGVGVYPKPRRSVLNRLKSGVVAKYCANIDVELLQKTLEINTQSMEQLRSILYSDIQTVRINDKFERPEMATDFTEHDLNKLNVLRQRGRESFANNEPKLKELLL